MKPVRVYAGSFGGAEQEGRGLQAKERFAAALTMQAHCLAEAAKVLLCPAQHSLTIQETFFWLVLFWRHNSAIA